MRIGQTTSPLVLVESSYGSGSIINAYNNRDELAQAK